MVCQWASAEWSLERVCLGIPEMATRKRRVDLSATAAAVMDDMEVSAADAISFTTDHEQAQRNALKTLASTMVGCSHHGIQLLPRHVLPLVRERRQVKAGDAGAEGNRRERSSRVPGSARLVARLDAEVARPPARLEAQRLQRRKSPSQPARLEACREVIRAFHWRTKLVAEAARGGGLTEELADGVLASLGWRQEALARQIWVLARWTRVSYSSSTYMEEAFHWWSNPWRLLAD